MYAISPSKYIIQLIIGAMTIQNSSKISNQGYIIDSFSSTLNIIQSKILSIENAESPMKFSSSIITITNSEFYNIKAIDTNPLIRIAFESRLTVNGLKYYNSQATFFSLITSTASISGLEVYNCSTTSNNTMMLMDDNINLELSNWNIRNISATQVDYILKISESRVSSMNNMTFSDISQYPLGLLSNNVNVITKLSIVNCARGLVIASSIISTIEHSNFTNLGSALIRKGGAISLEDSSINISKNVFNTNSALEGGAVNYECSTTAFCSVSITENSFTNNTGFSKGGAIGYNLYRPTLLNNTFQGNFAPYGINIGSYAVKVKLKERIKDKIHFSNVGSGISYSAGFSLALYDHDDQIMAIDNTSQIKISGFTPGSQVLGINEVKVTAGAATFSDVIFIQKPGATDVLFEVTSTGTNMKNLRLAYGQDYSLEKITVDFRFCKPGEIISNNRTCTTCSPGTYSLEWNSTQ